MKRCKCEEPEPVEVEACLATILCKTCGGWLAMTLTSLADLDKAQDEIK